MKQLKKIFLVTVFMICGFSLFAEETEAEVSVETVTESVPESPKSQKRMYIKGLMGFESGMPPRMLDYLTAFDLDPVFGFFPIDSNKNFAVEFGLDLCLYSGTLNYYHNNKEMCGQYSYVEPSVIALYYFKPENKFTMYAGGGLSLTFGSISCNDPDWSWFLWDEDDYDPLNTSCGGISIKGLLGGKYSVNDKVSLNGEFSLTLITNMSWGLRFGAAYKIR